MKYTEAKKIVKLLIARKFKDFTREVVIDNEYSFEFSRGWVFFYNTEEYVRDRNSDIYLIQAVPMLIDKIDGLIYKLCDPKKRFVAADELIDDYIRMRDLSIKTLPNLNYEELDFHKLPFTYQILDDRKKNN